jgi:hypothetical protein
MSVFIVPNGYNLVGTCGSCGGPVLQSMYSSSTDSGPVTPPSICSVCHKVVKSQEAPYGPILEMHE